MGAAETIILGVIAGVLSSAMIVLLATVFRRVFLPWYLNLTYLGVDLTGSWTAEVTNKSPFTQQELVIRQSSHKVSGDVLTTTNDPIGKAVIAQEINGQAWEGYLSLVFMPKDRSRTSYGVGFFKICEHGQSLDGHVVFRHGSNDHAASEPLRYRRCGNKTG